MLGARVIPCLLLRGRGLVKTVRFRQPKYVGDPINAVKIFNEKEAHELILLDIEATAHGRKPDLGLISEIASECFMPFCYGGGITSVKEVGDILGAGAEKVCVNSGAVERPELVRAIADTVGSQSVVVAMDVKKGADGTYEVFTRSARRATGLEPVECAVRMAELGAGELFVNSIDRDGTMEGYDLDLIRRVVRAVDVPVIACGGAGKLRHLTEAIYDAGASAAAAGSLFVFYGKHRAVLINYPNAEELEHAYAGRSVR
jgi:cyclase